MSSPSVRRSQSVGAGVTLVQTGAPVYGSTTTTSLTLVPTLPSAPSATDVLRLVVFNDAGTSITTPAGWTAVTSVVRPGLQTVVYYRTGSTATSYSVTLGASGATLHGAAVLQEIAGANAAHPVNVSASNLTLFGGAATIAGPSVTPTVNGLAIATWSWNDAYHDLSATFAPSGWNVDANASSGGVYANVGLSDAATAVAGTPLQTTATTSTAGYADVTMTGILEVIAPAQASAPALSSASHVKVYGGYYCSTTYNPTPCYHGYTYVSAAQLAAWATYAEPDGHVQDFGALEAAGIPHVLQYQNPNVAYTADPQCPNPTRGVNSDFLPGTGQTPYATVYGPGTAYWDLANAATLSYLEAGVAACLATSGATGAMFDDLLAAADPWGDGMVVQGVPSVSAWIADSQALWASALGKDVVVNGVAQSGAGPGADTNALQAIAVPTVLGALSEGCYVNASTNAVENVGFHEYGAMWAGRENAQLQTQALGKDFICLGFMQNGANNAGDRLYLYASMLLTYDPQHTVYWNTSTQPSTSRTDIYPEVQLVPAAPLVAQPANVSALAVGAVYVREYGTCYDAGSAIGPCAVVVNPTTAAQRIPAMPSGTTYAHQLAVSGDDVFNGGTITTAASAPGSLAAVSGTILFP